MVKLIQRVTPGRRAATGGTPAQFGFALRSWLQHHAFPFLTAQDPHAGWTEGGCGYLAHALLQWAGTGEVMAVWGRWDDQPGPQEVHHLVWAHGDLHFDGDGASLKQTLILRLMNEHYLDDVEVAPLGAKAKRSMERADISCHSDAIPELVEALQKRFGDPADWGFKATGRPAKVPYMLAGWGAHKWRPLHKLGDETFYFFVTKKLWTTEDKTWHWGIFRATTSEHVLITDWAWPHALITDWAWTLAQAETAALQMTNDGDVHAALTARRRKKLARVNWE